MPPRSRPHVGCVNETYVLRTDGAARGNPGPAGIGAVLEGPDGSEVDVTKAALGVTTNNAAEYQGLIAGLELAMASGAKRLKVLMDSLLVVQQMRGVYKVKHQGLQPLHQKAKQLASAFERIEYHAVPRAENARADGLANEAIDEATAGGKIP